MSREFRKNLPREERTEEERQAAMANPQPPVRVDYSITKVINLLKEDRQYDSDSSRGERSKEVKGERDSDVTLVERHADDDLKDHEEPDPNDIVYQNDRMRFGDLTREEKKRWKRRYKGEAVFMVSECQLNAAYILMVIPCY